MIMSKTIQQEEYTRREFFPEAGRKLLKAIALVGVAEETVRNLAACTAMTYGRTKPNLVSSSYPGYQHIAKKNPLLADEIGKLPEILDGVSVSEAAALEDLVTLYESDTHTFDTAFKEMYQVGLPDVRKYCSPLQALFWMAEDGKLSKGDTLLANYSLDLDKDYVLRKLLDTAWEFKEKRLALSEQQAKKIIESILDEERRKEYSYLRHLKDINETVSYTHLRAHET